MQKVNQVVPLLANEDITPFTVVYIPNTADFKVSIADAATYSPIGVSLVPSVDTVDASEGDRCDVIVSGIAKVKAGGAVTRGSQVMATTDGKVVNATTGKYTVGIALQTGVDGDIVAVLVNPGLLA